VLQPGQVPQLRFVPWQKEDGTMVRDIPTQVMYRNGRAVKYGVQLAQPCATALGNEDIVRRFKLHFFGITFPSSSLPTLRQWTSCITPFQATSDMIRAVWQHIQTDVSATCIALGVSASVPQVLVLAHPNGEHQRQELVDTGLT